MALMSFNESLGRVDIGAFCGYLRNFRGADFELALAALANAAKAKLWNRLALARKTDSRRFY